jgi:hypothetical protein
VARPLPDAPLDAPEPVASADAKEFGAAAEDFYPTELRARPNGNAVARSGDGGDTSIGF